MKKRSIYVFRYSTEEDGETIAEHVYVESTNQPDAEADADKDYRQFYLQRARINWARTRRDLVEVRDLTPKELVA